mgnify:CR=1 FL=1
MYPVIDLGTQSTAGQVALSKTISLPPTRIRTAFARKHTHTAPTFTTPSQHKSAAPAATAATRPNANTVKTLIKGQEKTTEKEKQKCRF